MINLSNSSYSSSDEVDLYLNDNLILPIQVKKKINK